MYSIVLLLLLPYLLSATTVASRRSRSFLSMGVQGLDLQKTKKKTTIPSTSTEFNSSSAVNYPRSFGAGADEHFPLFPTNGQIEQDASLLNKLEIYYRRYGLMSDLASADLNQMDKMNLIASASSDVLTTQESNIRPTNLKRAGLLNDWSFEM